MKQFTGTTLAVVLGIGFWSWVVLATGSALIKAAKDERRR